MLTKDSPEINRVIEAMIDAHRSTGASLRDVADAVLDRFGYSPSGDAVRALSAIDEAAQLARGELGEAAMKDGDAKDAGIARADRLLADGIRRANDALAAEARS
jgi:hypothetical protein